MLTFPLGFTANNCGEMNASGASNSKNICPPLTCDSAARERRRNGVGGVVGGELNPVMSVVDIRPLDGRKSWFICRTMEIFNYPVSKIGCDDKIMQTRRQLDEVMGMMRSNIEKLSERSERLEDLACRAEVLDMSSQEFQRCAGEVRRRKLWRAYAAKATVLAAVGVTVISTIAYFTK